MTLEKLRPRLRERRVSKQTQECFTYFRERAHMFIVDLLQRGELSAREQTNALQILLGLVRSTNYATVSEVMHLSLERLDHEDVQVRSRAAMNVMYFANLWDYAEQCLPEDNHLRVLLTPLREEATAAAVAPRLRQALEQGLSKTLAESVPRFIENLGLPFTTYPDE